MQFAYLNLLMFTVNTFSFLYLQIVEFSDFSQYALFLTNVIRIMFYLSTIIAIVRIFGFTFDIATEITLLNQRFNAIEEKMTSFIKLVEDKTYDIQEQINDTKCEILDTQQKIVKKNKKSLKSIKKDIEEVKNVTTEFDNSYSDLLSGGSNFEDIMTQSMQMLTKVLRGDEDPSTIISQVNENNTVFDLSKVSEVFSSDMEVLAKVYTTINSIYGELSEVTDTFFNEFNSRIKIQTEDCDHADCCPLCLSYDILTELNMYEGIIGKVLFHIKEYLLLLKNKKMDYYSLGDEDQNLHFIFMYNKGIDEVLEGCATLPQIQDVKTNNPTSKVMDMINKMMGQGSGDSPLKFLEDIKEHIN